jgi:hypothetical protein
MVEKLEALYRGLLQEKGIPLPSSTAVARDLAGASY